MLDAGDLFFKKYGNSAQENNSKNSGPKANLILESLNLMGYDAMAIGDDDLTLGKDFLSDLSKKAKFPFLSSNVIDEASGKPLFHSTLVKEVNGFRIGMFSLLAPEAFLSPEDSRKKGLTIRPPTEVAQAMVKELQPKTDFIFLLSHLGYPKDMELAQAVSGIHLIIGAHTGMNLVNPPVVKNTILLQTASKGMYVGKLDLTILNDDLFFFFNVSTKRTLENTLRNVTAQLGNAKLAEAEKKQLQKSKEDIEKKLVQLQGKNEFTNRVLPITENMKDYPEISKMIEEYHSKYPELPKPVSPQ
jgi:2',3'-cyclic-nucleotide 2'-phosphodiesterase (5'-nucleotidase family)